MDTSPCGRCCIYSFLVIMMIVSVSLFAFGIYYGQLAQDAPGAGTLQAIMIFIALLMALVTAVFWIWMCKRSADRKKMNAEAEKAAAAAAEGEQELPESPIGNGDTLQNVFASRYNNGTSAPYDGTMENGLRQQGRENLNVDPWLREWSSDSSVRIWGSQEPQGGL